MPLITATISPLVWVVQSGSALIESGLTQVGEATCTGLTFISGASEAEFLAAVVTAAPDVSAITPLPEYGQPCEGGAIYAYNGALVICRKSHNRTEHAPETVPALFAVYREDADEALEWVAGEGVLIGTRRLYAGALYQCLLAHQTQADWTPPAVPALWAEVSEIPGEWVSGEQGIQIGDRRTYQGVIYECRQNPGINIWPPPTVPALWLVIGPE